MPHHTLCSGLWSLTLGASYKRARTQARTHTDSPSRCAACCEPPPPPPPYSSDPSDVVEACSSVTLKKALCCKDVLIRQKPPLSPHKPELIWAGVAAIAEG